MQEVQDLLTENQVIEGVQNFLYQKGHTAHRRVVTVADAARKEHGVDLIFKLENDKHKGNTYFIEAKGNLKSGGTPILSKRRTNFRWAIAQIILDIKVDSRNNNYIYGIAMPRSDIEHCKKLIEDNWALKHLRLRLYGAFCQDGKLTAVEYLPKDLYK